MSTIVEYQTVTVKDSNLGLILGFWTARCAYRSMKMQTESWEDDYDRKVELIRRAFNEISRLAFEWNYTLTAEDWRALDEAMLDDPALSYAEVRARLIEVYKRIRRACRGAAYAQREAQAVQ